MIVFKIFAIIYLAFIITGTIGYTLTQSKYCFGLAFLGFLGIVPVGTIILIESVIRYLIS